jgi:alkylation response protein AidB-like acyl-CoA dehydrogenase
MSDIDIMNTAKFFARDVTQPPAQSWENEKKQLIEVLQQAAKLGLMAIDTPVSFGATALTEAGAAIADIFVVDAQVDTPLATREASPAFLSPLGIPSSPEEPLMN